MRTVAKAEAREEAFLRSLRPPELRDADAEWYAAIVREAYRIRAAEERIRNVRRSMDEAAESFRRGTWPERPHRAWWPPLHEEEWSPDTHFDIYDPATLCWAIDIFADSEGMARLDAVQGVARRHSSHWNYIYAAGVVGALRSKSSYDLVRRARPLTWTLTEKGRELMDLVFGSEPC